MTVDLLGNRIQQAREARGMSQSELARRLRVKPQTVQQWEAGVTSPKRARWAGLADILGVSREFFLDPAPARVQEIGSSYGVTKLRQDEAELISALRRLPLPIRASINTLITWCARRA